MFRFGFKKKWKGNKESNEREQPPTNGIKLLTFRAIDNEFTPRAPVVENIVPRRPRVKRNALEVFRQSYPNFPAVQNSESNPYKTVQFPNSPAAQNRESSPHETVQFPNSPAVQNLESNPQETVQFATVQPRQEFVPVAVEKEEKSTLIFMTEDHGDDVEDVEMGAAYQQSRMQEVLPSVEQEQELEDIYGARMEDQDSIGYQETVELEDDDNFRIHVVQHTNDAMSMVSYQSGDTLLDSVLQDERPGFADNYNYNFVEAQEVDDKSETENDDDDVIAINDKLEEPVFEINEQIEKRVMFDVSDDEEVTIRRKVKPEIIHTPLRKETLEDVKMKPGYSLQASALFFSGANDGGNESDTSA